MCFYLFSLVNLSRLFFLKGWLTLESLGILSLDIPNIAPNRKTRKTFELLKRIYLQAEAVGIRVWVSGSWAVVGRNGGAFFKDINDIDLTLCSKEEEERLARLLESLGLSKSDKSPTGVRRYLDVEHGIGVDFGATAYPGTICYQLPLAEERVEIDGFSFRVVPRESHIVVYQRLLFSPGRSLRNDLVKLKILFQAAFDSHTRSN